MTSRFSIIYVLFVGIVNINSCQYSNSPSVNGAEKHPNKIENDMEKPHFYFSLTDTQPLVLTDSVWKTLLSPELYYIARQKGTEYAFSGKYWNYEGVGKYHCAACGNFLFTSDAKFASSCGWPSFFEPARKDAMKYYTDNSHGMQRTEVTCGRCDSHLGHIFNDGPPPTGMRYCMNSLMLLFVEK
jgi:peptide-methionine (R)-S-oxide reductase